MTSTAVAEPKVTSEEYELRVADIDPDPQQPRLEVDDGLAASIKEHGVLKAIEVRPHPETPGRWMIVDGERRWSGARKAGCQVIPAKVTFDVEGVNIADRMIRQIVHNTGKPLTPVEEAIAFKKIIEARRQDQYNTAVNGQLPLGDKPKLIAKGDKKYGPVQLSRDLGIPKSTITDRLAMTEIPDFWLKLIVKGPLQASHVPALHRYRQVPEKYQRRALEKMTEHHGWQREGGERVYVDEFQRWLDEAMRSFIKPLKEVPGYKGPTAKLADARGGYFRRATPIVFALDPTLWEPIYRKRLTAKRAKTRAAGGVEAKEQKTRDRYEEQRQRDEQQREREDRARKRYWEQRGAIRKLLADRLQSLPVPQLLQLVFVSSWDRAKAKRVADLVPVGNTAEQTIRHIVAAFTIGECDNDWRFKNEVHDLAKRLKLEKEILALVKAASSTPDGDDAEGDD
jgi:hypothetical protein